MDDATKKWFHDNAENYGLYFPMSHEPWHIQLKNVPTNSAGGGMTDPNLAFLISKESGGRTDADNPTSTAFGLGQLIEANRKAYGQKFGFDPNTTDYNQQLTMMTQYIKDRYGSTENAAKFWKEHGWY
jgi:hypothetical protein